VKPHRIVLTVPESSPELFEELQHVPSRHRAERVRILATVGLLAMKSGGPSAGHAAAVIPQTAKGAPEAQPVAPGVSSHALEAARRIGESM